METAGKEIENEDLKEQMKGKGLGTPATRSGIIEILIKRSFIIRKGKQLIPTTTGIDLIEKLEIIRSVFRSGQQSRNMSFIKLKRERIVIQIT